MAEDTPEVIEDQSMDDFMGDQFDALEGAEPEESPSEATHESPEADVSEPEEDSVAEAADTDVESEVSEPESQIVTAPQSMSAKDREAFYALPPESQQWISDRVKSQEADYTRKTMEVAEQRKVYDKLEQAIAPRRQEFAMNGMDEGTAIGQLLALSDYANKAAG